MSCFCSFSKVEPMKLSHKAPPSSSNNQKIVKSAKVKEELPREELQKEKPTKMKNESLAMMVPHFPVQRWPGIL
ncbi:hypothetical protein KFK09_024500 [Dendrobium nobile]|uniref:Uncharacterized protein n=1 Tax=Dendrobium nobile TaxID=94219 RepID=A0A8T3ACU0_DENNO|nr:hypothetical protein KFK09_024500 [Dendrobium nobile]